MEHRGSERKFVTDSVLNQVSAMIIREVQRLSDLKRQVVYALSVHEPIAEKDQDTVSRYVLLLEHTLDRVLHRRHNLEFEVNLLKKESDLLRYRPDELNVETDALLRTLPGALGVGSKN